MKYLYSLIFLATISCGVPEQRHAPTIEVNFSPNGGVAAGMIREIDAAKSTIRVAAYSFTNVGIGEALLSAHKRGVDVQIVVDSENLGNPHSLLVPLARAGLLCYLDKKHSIFHNKYLLIDGDTVITGSANFSKGADESNAENSIILKYNPDLYKKYVINWKLHKEHSIPYIPTE